MKNYIVSWRSSMNSDQNPLVLQEGLFDIGLPAILAEELNQMFGMIPEKGKTILGKTLKNTSLTRSFGKTNHSNKNVLTAFIAFFGEIVRDILHKDLNTGGEWKANNEGVTQAREVMKTFEEMLGWNSETAQLTDPTIAMLAKAAKFAVKSLSKGAIYKILKNPDIVAEYISKFMIRLGDIYQSIVASIFDQSIDLFAWLSSHQDMWKKIPDILKKWTGDESTAFWGLTMYAHKWVINKESDEQILHKFDNGLYWYDLRTDMCDVEGERMGHCGGDYRATTLLSLRFKSKGKMISSSRVTVAYNADKGIIYQLKGKANMAPEKEYWPSIVWLINKLDVAEVEEGGEHSDDFEGFFEMAGYLKEHTGAHIATPVNSWEALREALAEIKDNAAWEFGYGGVEYEVNDEFGGEYANFEYQGWMAIELPEEIFNEGILDAIKKGNFGWQRMTSIAQDMSETIEEIYDYSMGVPQVFDGKVVFRFVIDADGTGSQYGDSQDPDDFETFASEVSILNERGRDEDDLIVKQLKRILATDGFLKASSFFDLYAAIEDDHEDWGDWATGVSDDDNNYPSSITVMFPGEVHLDMDKMTELVELPYYQNPKVAQKILKSQTFQKKLADQMSKIAGRTTKAQPRIAWYNVEGLEIAAAWAIEVDEENSEEKVDTMSAWLGVEFEEIDFNEIVRMAFYQTLNEAFDEDFSGSQQSLDFPGGKRLAVNERQLHSKLHKNWAKNFKGF